MGIQEQAHCLEKAGHENLEGETQRGRLANHLADFPLASQLSLASPDPGHCGNPTELHVATSLEENLAMYLKLSVRMLLSSVIMYLDASAPEHGGVCAG